MEIKIDSGGFFFTGNIRKMRFRVVEMRLQEVCRVSSGKSAEVAPLLCALDLDVQFDADTIFFSGHRTSKMIWNKDTVSPERFIFISSIH